MKLKITKKDSIFAFTLTETILFMGIFAVLLVVIGDIFGQSISLYKETQSSTYIKQDSSYIASRILFDIKRTDEIVVPVENGIVSDELALLIDGATYTYRIQDNNLSIDGPNGSVIINSNMTTIDELSFVRYGNTDGKNSIHAKVTLLSTVTKDAGQVETNEFEIIGGIR